MNSQNTLSIRLGHFKQHWYSPLTKSAGNISFMRESEKKGWNVIWNVSDVEIKEDYNRDTSLSWLYQIYEIEEKKLAFFPPVNIELPHKFLFVFAPLFTFHITLLYARSQPSQQSTMLDCCSCFHTEHTESWPVSHYLLSSPFSWLSFLPFRNKFYWWMTFNTHVTHLFTLSTKFCILECIMCFQNRTITTGPMCSGLIRQKEKQSTWFPPSEAN